MGGVLFWGYTTMEERTYTRKQFLKTAMFKKAMSDVASVLDRFSVKFALVGGLAVAYHANPPVTVDIDLLLMIGRKSQEEHDIMGAFMDEGWRSHPLHFGYRHIGLPKSGHAIFRDLPQATVDLIFAGGDPFLAGAVQDAEVHEVQSGLHVPVISTEDLIIMKTLVGRDKDLADVSELYLAHPDVDETYIEETLSRLE